MGSEKGVQHLLRQTLLRRNQLAKRNSLKDLKKYKRERFEYYQGVIQQERIHRSNVKNERVARREDWLKGPLAPKRDVGEKEGIYGALPDTLARAVELPERLRLKKEDVNIVAGDRVVVVKGRGRGQIGEVSDVELASMTCRVDNIRAADFPIPPSHPMAKQANKKYAAQPLSIPLSDVRLVVPVEDTVTREKRDVVVRHVSTGEPTIERSDLSSLPKHTRYIAGTDTPIPWPKEEVPDPRAEEGDTRRQDVEHESYIPDITLDSVMPGGVIDELRNPFSRTRLMHDDAFVKEKLLVDVRRAWERERARSGMTPTEEFWAQKEKTRKESRRRQRAAGVSSQTLHIIAEEMARARL